MSTALDHGTVGQVLCIAGWWLDGSVGGDIRGMGVGDEGLPVEKQSRDVPATAPTSTSPGTGAEK
jgi:hypothetical protein